MPNLPELSEGAIGIIMSGGAVDSAVLQVLSLKKMSAANGETSKDRYRCFLSDGKYSISFAMMNSNVYQKAGPDGLDRFSVIKVIKYITSVINNTGGKDSRVLLILDMEVLARGDEVNDKIGKPTPYDAVVPNSNGATRAASSELERPEKRPRIENGSSSNGTSLHTSSNNSMNVSVSGTGQIIHPIISLSPYHNRWVIMARVSNKSQIRTWSNSKSEGKLFSADLVDESGEIRITFFKDHVDKYYDMLQIDKVYYISKCQIKPANKQFTSIKHDYEMTCHNETIIEECKEDVGAIPQTKYDFTPIDKIQQIEVNTFVDVIAVVKSVGDLQTFTAKSTGRELRKKEIVLVDKSNTAISLTLWNAEAENFDGSSNPVLVLKGAKVGEYGGGKNLSTGSGTVMKINPEMSECYQMKGWFDSEGSKTEYKNISGVAGGGNFNTPWHTFKEVTELALGNSEKGDYYMNKGTILLVRSENCLYKACPTADCQKKVVDMNTGMFRCEKCNREFPNYKWRYLCSMNVGDYSDNQWVNLFNTEAEKVIGMTAEELGQIHDNDPSKFVEVLQTRHFMQFTFKFRAKVEIYNDESRLKTVAVRVDPVNHEEFNAHLCSQIEQFLNV